MIKTLVSLHHQLTNKLKQTTMQTVEQQKQIAATILMQLGGNRFIAMTGAKNFVCGENMFLCQIGRNAAGVTNLRIKLNSMDLYDMEFIRVRGMKVTTIATKENVYNDMLQSIFTQVTGLYTSL